jgi:hypothetical protein
MLYSGRIPEVLYKQESGVSIVTSEYRNKNKKEEHQDREGRSIQRLLIINEVR